jgi:hypothetical protein
LFQDWNIGVGVFPECEKSLVSMFRLGRVAHHRAGSAEFEMCESTGHKIQDDASMVKHVLELEGGGGSGQSLYHRFRQAKQRSWPQKRLA